jgi:Sec-independent protein translocase protein TatA
LASGIGKGIRNFKKEMNDTSDEVASAEEVKKVESNTQADASETPKSTTQA